MHLSIAIVVSCSFVALLLAGGYGDEGNSEQGSCKKLETRLEIDDPEFDESIIRFVYNETLKRCIYDLVKPNETNSYENFYDCVTKCNTGQGAPRCVQGQISDCSEGDDCDEFFTYDIQSERCIPINTTYANYIANASHNIFLRQEYCQNDCSYV
uniref:BPTI/Kunitz inhibitor domain-containing protein n=1 Tax=Amblyomma maculatum TaxID=34609 RepID=G3MSB9_AMBMU